MPSSLKSKDCRCPCHIGVKLLHPVPCCNRVDLKLPKEKKPASPRQMRDLGFPTRHQGRGTASHLRTARTSAPGSARWRSNYAEAETKQEERGATRHETMIRRVANGLEEGRSRIAGE